MGNVELSGKKKGDKKMKEEIFDSLGKTAFIGALSALLFTLTVTVNAQCGGSFDALAASALSLQNNPRLALRSSLLMKDQINPFQGGDNNEDQDWPIVGLWQIKFNIMVPGVPDPITIQEAFQIWNTGGTEVHNPNVDSRTGSVCLGAWREDRGTFKLTHRVWSYSPDGVWLGTINLAESVRVTNRGRNQTGTFSLDFFDPAGNPLDVPGVHPAHVEGVVVAERISAN